MEIFKCPEFAYVSLTAEQNGEKGEQCGRTRMGGMERNKKKRRRNRKEVDSIGAWAQVTHLPQGTPAISGSDILYPETLW